MTAKPGNSMMFVVCALVLFLVTSTAQAATFYVATTGNDSNPGTLAQPFRTMRQGVSVLRPGDTTFVRGGTYFESFDTNHFTFPSGTSWTSAVTLAVYPGETVSMNGTFNFGAVPNQYIIIDGLIIDAINGVNEGVSINQGSHHIRFQNCEIRNSYMNGVGLWWGNNNGLSSDYNEFINCKIHHNGRWGGSGFPDQAPGYGRGHGLYITTSNNVFRGNRIYDNGEYGLHLYNGNYPSNFVNNNVADGNLIYSNGHNTTRYGSVCCGGITAGSGSGSIIRNNIVYSNRVNGIEVGSSCTNCKAFNNTTYNNPGWNIYSIDGGSGKEVRNNIAYPKGIYSGTGTVSSNNLSTNPNFVNAAGNDFRLLSSSPAVDAGMTISTVTLDFARNPRPQGAGHDIGAHEFGGGTGSAPAPPQNLSVR
jgi:parallel beta-helix repeat protein